MTPRPSIYVTSLIAAAFFMENLDGTIIATALPQMAMSFHVGAVNLNIGMTAYLLTLAVFIPISGWVADRFGSRTVFAAAIGIFTLASLFCSMAHTLTQFTLMRILQGLGGAMMVPVGRLIVLRNTPTLPATSIGCSTTARDRHHPASSNGTKLAKRCGQSSASTSMSTRNLALRRGHRNILAIHTDVEAGLLELFLHIHLARLH